MSQIVKYRPEIDGLRAIAVLPVLLFHADIGFFSGGYVGVDIFFVISGFLITSILYKEISLGSFSYIAFYERRARRILPALYAVLLASLIAAWFLLIPDDLIDFAQTLIATVGFYANISLWLQIDYFDQAAELKPLLHMWSLAVEEQYYIFLPILLMAIIRYAKKHILVIIIATLALSILTCHWAAYNKPSANYYLLPTRAWELLIGSTVALLQIKPDSMINRQLEKNFKWLSTLALLLIFTSIFFLDEQTPFPSLWALLPTVGAALLILCAKPNTIAHKLLTNKLLVGTGLISYSAYLWHQPIYAFARHQTVFEISPSLMVTALALSMLLAYLSWRLIEQPFRNRNCVTNRSVWLFSAIGSLAFIVIGLYILKYDGLATRNEIKLPLTEATFDLPLRSNGWCFYSVDTNSALPLGNAGLNCVLGSKSGKIKALLFGDSFAGMYEPLWDTIGKDISIEVNAVTTNWCHPSFSKNFWWKNETRALEQCLINRDYVEKNIKNYDVIIISAIWNQLENKNLLAEVFELIDTITIQNGINVIVMDQPVRLKSEDVNKAVYKGLTLKHKDPIADSVISTNSTFKKMVEENKKLFFIDRQSLFTPPTQHQYLVSADGIPYSWDGSHISIYGSLQAGKNLIQNKKYSQLKDFLGFN